MMGNILSLFLILIILFITGLFIYDYYCSIYKKHCEHDFRVVAHSFDTRHMRYDIIIKCNSCNKKYHCYMYSDDIKR